MTMRPPRGMTESAFVRSAWDALIGYERGDRHALGRLSYAQEIAVGELPLRSACVFKKVSQFLNGSAGNLLPFGSLMVAYQADGLMTWGPRLHALPVAPWTPDPLRAPWVDLYSGAPVHVIGTPDTDEEWESALEVGDRTTMIAATYVDALRQHRDGTEYKYVANNGRPATLRCGLLRRRPVFVDQSVPIGKETRFAEEAQAGVMRAEEMDTVYENIDDDPSGKEHEDALRNLQSLISALRPVPRKWLATRVRISEQMLRAIIHGHKRPGTALAQQLCTIAQAVERSGRDLIQAEKIPRRRTP